ncbi:hypothetical protein F4776DRAFT_639647 [Hypoxylon sp. NC0597]|nr:hypothetical protein F4776DRAFT_639647 [Hypoxylon sp. NC0597]
MEAMFALRDNENNLEIASRASKTAEEATTIAEETKRDSPTMTSIAALSMIFLPGTFVAVSRNCPLYQICAHSKNTEVDCSSHANGSLDSRRLLEALGYHLASQDCWQGEEI